MASREEIKQQKLLNQARTEAVRINREINKQLDETAVKQEAVSKLTRDVNDGLRKEVDQYGRSAVAQKAVLDAAREHLATLERQADANRRILQRLEAQNEVGEGLVGKDAERLRIYRQIVAATDEELALRRANERQARVQQALAERRKEAATAVKDRVKDLVSLTTMVNDGWRRSTLPGRLAEAAKQGIGLSSRLGLIVAQTRESLSTSNMLGSTYQKVAEATAYMVRETMEARAAFNKQTSAAGRYNTMITRIRIDNASFGVGVRESSAALASLYNGMTAFTEMTDRAQQRLGGLIARLNVAGMTFDSLTKMADIASRTFGMTGAQTERLAKELGASAKAMKISFNKIVSDFGQAMSTLAMHGTKGIQIFKALEAQAKATGIGVNQLLQISSQFNYLDQAAQITGRLNAILGGPYLNTVRMVRATEEDRINQIQKAIRASGALMGSESRYYKLAIARALNIQDMTVLQRLLGNELNRYNMALRAGVLSEKELKQITTSSITEFERMRKVFESLAVALRPIIGILNYVSEGLLKIQSVTKDWFVPAIFGAIIAFRTFTKVMFAMKLGMPSLIGMRYRDVQAIRAQTAAGHQQQAQMAMSQGQMATYEAQTARMAVTGRVAAASTRALGAAMAGIGLGIGAAAAGLGILANFVESDTDILAMTVAFGGMGAAMIGLSFAGKSAAAGVGIFAAAFLKLSLGITIINAGLTALVYVFGLTVDKITTMVRATQASSAGLSVLSKILGATAFGGMRAALAISQVAAGLVSLKLSLAFIDKDKLSSVAQLISGLAQLKNVAANVSLSGFAKEVAEITRALDGVDPSKLASFGSSMQSVGFAAKSFAEAPNASSEIRRVITMVGNVKGSAPGGGVVRAAGGNADVVRLTARFTRALEIYGDKIVSAIKGIEIAQAPVTLDGWSIGQMNGRNNRKVRTT